MSDRLTVAKLREMLAELPDDTPVIAVDDMGYGVPLDSWNFEVKRNIFGMRDDPYGDPDTTRKPVALAVSLPDVWRAEY